MHSFDHLTTKITATIGPSSINRVSELLQCGVNVFRLNFSHGNVETQSNAYNRIREASVGPHTCTTIIQDLQGPKIRCGVFANARVTLKPGQQFRFTKDLSPGDESRVGLPHPEIFQAFLETPDVKHFVLLDDGKVKLDVISVTEDEIVCKSELGGVLSDRKGVNLPTVQLGVSAMTEKDKQDLCTGLKLGVDYICLSFVQSVDDVIEAREYMNTYRNYLCDNGGTCPIYPPKIISKIEKPQALENIEAIIAESDAIMLARGDLGVEIPFAQVPVVQKRVVALLKQAGKPLIIATHCLESMIENPRPTRGEVGDVAGHIFDGADSVMLSGESASGAHPLEAVSAMASIIKSTEQYILKNGLNNVSDLTIENDTDAVARSAKNMAQSIGAKAIVNFTESGFSSLRLSRTRPGVPIIATSPHLSVLRCINLGYGILPVKCNGLKSFDEIPKVAASIALDAGIGVQRGDKVVVVAGCPFGFSQANAEDSDVRTTSFVLIATC
ncbi:hypothetical protein P9112_012520 [Eukaryota sp. TZLM1-RC]